MHVQFLKTHTVEVCTKNKEVHQGTENYCTSISRPSPNAQLHIYIKSISYCTSISRPSPNAESTGTVSNDTVDSARQDAVAIGSPLSGGPCAQYTRNNPEPQEITSFGTETITEVQSNVAIPVISPDNGPVGWNIVHSHRLLNLAFYVAIS